MAEQHTTTETTRPSTLMSDVDAIYIEATTRLDTIIHNFCETGSVTDKNHDDLFFELEFENDSAFNDDPENAIRITLLQLLQASTVHLQAGSADADHCHIHHLIEYALIEQEGLRIIGDLLPVTESNDFTAAHFEQLDAALRPYLSEHGRLLLDRIGAQSNGLPDLHASPYLRFGQTTPQPGDPESEPAFVQALGFLEAITQHLMEFDDLWEKTAADLAYELTYHNRWAAFEAKQHSQAFSETSLQELLALSRRRLLACEETNGENIHYARILHFIDKLIEEASAAESEIAAQISPTLKTASSVLGDELTNGK